MIKTIIQLIALILAGICLYEAHKARVDNDFKKEVRYMLLAILLCTSIN